MAIIYTYPVKTVPSLHDSIVITDEADNKKTKITGIGAIIALITGDFCTTSMSQINPDVGDIVTAVDCETIINFTSLDASVTITGDNATKTIDFKSTGGGGGGCPTTYIIKPIRCLGEPEDCVAETDTRYWHYTCDETLGALAPGYIENLVIGGETITSDSGCFWIEEKIITADATTCCCPAETEYKLSPCEMGLTIYYTTEALTAGIGALVGAVVLITTPAGELCYTVSEESGDPPIAVTLGAVQEFGCESDDCSATPTYSFVDCTDSSSYVTGEIEPPYPIGKVFTFCCEGGTEFQTVKCWEYVGDVGQPVGGTFDPCVNFGAELDNCDCCFNRCNYTYTACVGGPAGFPATLTFNVGMDAGTSCLCNTPENDIVVTNDSLGTTWCYNSPEAICLAADEGYTISGIPDAPCDDAVYCPGVPATYTWQECDGGPYITVAVDPGIPVGQIDRYCCGEEEKTHHCYEYLGNIGQPVAGAFPCAGPIESYASDCECCLNPCTYKYTACPGYPGAFSEFIWVGVGFDVSGCDCNIPDPDVYITVGEETWCYNTPVKECVPGSTIITGLAPCGDSEICPSTLRWKMCSEGVESWRYEDELDPIPAPFDVPGNHYVGELNTPGTCVNGDCCIEVEATISLGATVAWSTFLAATGCDSAYNETWEDCACCENYDVVEYTACDPTCDVGEPAAHYPTIYVDVCEWGNYIGESWKPANAPTFITLSPGGEECCYELTDNEPCVPETLISIHGFTYDDLGYGDPLWIDCTCTDIVYFQYRECGGEWIDTDTDLDAYNGGGAWENLAGDTCYEIQEGGAGGPIVDPAILFVTEYYGVGPLLPCDCCEQDLREYTICDGAAGVTCNALAPATLYIDVSSIVGYDPITYGTVVGEEISSSIQCCYTYVDEADCQPATGTIISTAGNCEDVACNLL